MARLFLVPKDRQVSRRERLAETVKDLHRQIIEFEKQLLDELTPPPREAA